MKSNQWLVSLALGLGLALGLLWLLGSQSSVALADPGILYVAPGGNCGGATPCYATVQAAVDAADPGDVIKVASGVYTGVQGRAAPAGYDGYNGPAVITQVVYLSETVTIRGGYTTAFTDPPDPEANPTTLDAQEQGRVLVIAGTIAPTIEGLRITGGDATGLGGDHWGYDAGGGLFLWYSDATATISNNRVFSNAAHNGGGLYMYKGAATLSANTVTSNTANEYGGGLFLYDSDATLSVNTVIFNTANSGGGGLFLYYSDATLSANIVIFNTANGGGGGLFLQGGAATLTNNVVADNQGNVAGSGLYLLDSSPRLLHTTIARNHGGDGSGLYVAGSSNRSTATLTNTILVSHTVGIAVTVGNTATLEATLWHNNGSDTGGGGTILTGTVNVYNDPVFADPSAWDYHLTAVSPAIDAGVDAGVTTDIDGDARPQGAGYDIGADEFGQWYVYLPLVVKNRAN
ncbi:MAG: choice-of-anchor Q domain-containing protein [Anaerolineae bacterium]